MYGLAAVSLLERRPDGAGCDVVASAGDRPPEGYGADLEVPVDESMTLAGRGRRLGREDLRVLRSCATQIVAGIGSRRREEQDAEAAWHTADFRGRAALLAATGEHAREQLTAARTALDALAAAEDRRTALAPSDRAGLLAQAARAVDQLSRLLDDLRDLSRLHTGAIETYLGPVDLDEVLGASLDDLGPGRQAVSVSLAEDLPDVIADATILTRILASLLADASYRCPAGPPPVLTAASLDGRVEVRITDQGPDAPAARPASRSGWPLTSPRRSMSRCAARAPRPGAGSSSSACPPRRTSST